ncbi:glycoside hydrolase family 43 protein [Vibrio mangrovi]|uniref:Beta-xylosidase n=1 Tax=Vibrio mangrovi TaxID=474394 RepID=A0A1Y6ISJ5_9VIBR|nr:glycoside hydrolase family 43 protein [Vibrio mangrovi]MDW6001354.1 glycoside hydrolase family 43 protein [Vibrio mangrovi]SMS00624.1 Beta-xylosidase [Vibrio mangrovi]
MKQKKLFMLFSALIALVGMDTALASEAKFERFSYHGESDIQANAHQYVNPVMPGFYPDPSVTRVGDDYYLVNSSFGYFPGLPIFHSKDLVSWQQIGNAFDRYEQFNFANVGTSRGIFAPDISYHDGLFYLTSTCVECSEHFLDNFVMTAKEPQGPWSEPVSLGFGGIDPSIFWDDDGKAYIVHNDDPQGGSLYDGHKAIWLQQFDPQSMKMVGERTQVINGGVDLKQQPFWIEGPHIFKKDGQYYLTAAEGGTESNHSQVIFRANSIKGPYLPYAHNPILTQRTLKKDRKNPVANAGHADLVQTQSGDWWSVFLAVRPYDQTGDFSTGRETFLLPVTWKDGWPVILEPGKPVPLVVSRPEIHPSGQAIQGSLKYSDEFNEDQLSLRWISLRNTKAPLYRLEQGALMFRSGGRIGNQKEVPAFVGVRQQHNQATVSTTLAFSPQHNGDQAGLVALQSDQSFLFYGIEKRHGKNILAVFSREQSAEDRLIRSVPLPAETVDLTVHINGGKMTFDYRVNGQSKILLADFDTRFLSTTKAGGFVGTVIGLYAYQK